MHHLLLAATVTVALLTLTAAPAAAAGPERHRLTPYSVDIVAGDVCDFALHLAVTDAHSTVMTFPVDRNGDQRVQYVGQETVVATNVEDDISITIQEGVRITYLYHANGSLDVYADGIAISWYFPTDVGGPSMGVYIGHLHDTLTASFTATGHEFVGRTWDLCAALAP